jgi:hypothetical protein
VLYLVVAASLMIIPLTRGELAMQSERID